MPPSKLTELRRMVEKMTPGTVIVTKEGRLDCEGSPMLTQHGVSASDCQACTNSQGFAALRNAAPDMLDALEAAGAIVQAWEDGHEESHMFMINLRTAMEKFGRKG